jgi:hypothetical protein
MATRVGSPLAGDAVHRRKTHRVQTALNLTSTPTGCLTLLMRWPSMWPPTRLTGDRKMGWIFGIIYFVLLVTLGVVSLRKGHWVMFIFGLFIPIFWFIGALLPRRVARV